MSSDPVGIQVSAEGNSSESENDSYLKLGKWVFYGNEFYCITHVGSNYVQLTNVFEGRIRVHFSESDSITPLTDDEAEAYIKKRSEEYKTKIFEKQAEIKQLTSSLNVAGYLPTAETGGSSLAVIGSGRDPDSYKNALIKAKNETLPELYREVKQLNQSYGTWMASRAIPFSANENNLSSTVDEIKSRLFSLELYSGVHEDLYQFRKGETAGTELKIHLMQRKHFMDEESLLNYKIGGMKYANLNEFLDWLAVEENFKRILPFPKCVVAFQVRRFARQFIGNDIREFFAFAEEARYDKFTFLMIRNGDNGWCLSTKIDFGDSLFPSFNFDVNETQWVKINSIDFNREDAFQFFTTAEKDQICMEEKSHGYSFNRWAQFSKESVYYDDIVKALNKKIRDHDRIGLVIQGLLDRSEVFNPHPDWKIWDDDDFNKALELVYDKTRALVPGEEPDFDVYFKDLASKIDENSVVMGQDRLWAESNYAKNHIKIHGKYEYDDYEGKTYRPYGNPGPGLVSKIGQIKGGKCYFYWHRKVSNGKRIRHSFAAKKEQLFNISAYKPGDFKKFFEDPRTRAYYAKWANYMLTAEEFHAGNIQAVIPDMTKTKLEPTEEGSMKYQIRKRNKAMVGKICLLTRDVTLKSGHIHKFNENFWKVCEVYGGDFNVMKVTRNGEPIQDDHNYIRRLKYYDLEEV